MADLTAQELIDAALRVLGAIDPGETPGTTERTNGLEAMKIMLRQWSAKGLFVPFSTEDTHSLTSGTKSYTIGSGATIDTARPERILDAYVTSGGIDYPLNIVGQAEYLRVYDKDAGYDIPDMIWYHPGYATGTLYLWPPGAGTLHLWSIKPITEYGLTDSVAIPGVYDAAIKYALAVHMAPEYGGLRDPMVASLAQEAYDDVMRYNLAHNISAADTDFMGGYRKYNIDEG